jgi:predicted permease
VRYAFRLLRRQPAFTATAAVALAFGIGVNTTTFTILNAIVLRPIPVPDAREIVRLRPIDQRGVQRQMFAYEDYEAFRAALGSTAGLIGFRPAIAVLSDTSGQPGQAARFLPEEAIAGLVSDNYFEVLKIRAAIGRTFRAEEAIAGHANAVVVSDRLWRRRFASDPQLVGQAVRISGQWFTVVGVAPPEFVGTEVIGADFWVPLTAWPLLDPQGGTMEERRRAPLLIVARLGPQTTAADLASMLTVSARARLRAHPELNRPAAVITVPGTFFTPTRELVPFIVIVMSAVALVLIVACANVANLMLARATARQHEIATRLALGASRLQVVRQLLIEGVVVGSIGGTAGLLLAWWSLTLLYPMFVDLVPYAWARLVLHLQPDWRVFGFTLALSLVASITAALAPALHATREGRTRGVLAASSDASSRSRARLRGGLVVVQVAVCLVLLASSGLLLRALMRAKTLDLGFDTTQVLHVDGDLVRQGYDAARAATFARELAVRARRLPGVTDVTLASAVPLAGGQRAVPISALGQRVVPESERLSVPYNLVTQEYFNTLRIPIVRGRHFTASEIEQRAAVVVISETIARMLWPGEDPLGKTLRVGSAPATQADGRPFLASAEIVGVARDARAGMLFESQQSYLYLPLPPQEATPHLHLLLRTTRDLKQLAPVVMQDIRQMDPALMLAVRPFDQLLSLWLLPSRVGAAAGFILGAIALLLAIVGIYGVMSYAVAERTREIGIRMALGANASDVLDLVIRYGIRLAGVGILAGLALTAAVTRFLVRFLAGVNPLDPATLATVCLFLASVAMVASYVPARRATRIDPISALRHD